MATAQLKQQFDASCELLKYEESKKWLNIDTQQLKNAVPTNTDLYTEVNSFIHKTEDPNKGYIPSLKISFNRCITQISNLIAKAKEIPLDQASFNTLDACTKLSAIPDSKDIPIPGLTTRPRAGVTNVSPLQKALRNTTDLYGNIHQFNVGQNGSFDGASLTNVFVKNVDQWVFNQFDNDENISKLTEQWKDLVDEHKTLLEDRFALEREFEVTRWRNESFSKCGVPSWTTDVGVSKLREGLWIYDFSKAKYFAARANQSWQASRDAWANLKTYADSRPATVDGDKIVYPPLRNDSEIDRWVNSLNARAQMNFSNASSAVPWKDRDATGYETRLIQDASRKNAVTLKHNEVNGKVNEAQRKIDALGALYWGLSSFRRDMKGVMWSLSCLVQAIFQLEAILLELQSDLRTLQVHVWAGETEAASPFLVSATKNFGKITSWIKTTDVRRPDLPFHCAYGINDYHPSDPPAPSGMRPPTEKFIQALSGFDMGIHDGFIGVLNSLTEDNKIPYLDADAGGELLWSRTNWIAFPSFAGYPSYEIGELKLNNNDMDESGNTTIEAVLTTDFSEDACYAVWIKSFTAAEYKGMIDISLSITDFDAAAKKMNILLVEGPLSNVTRITIGYIVYSKEADGPKRITSWEKAYDFNNFVYQAPQLLSGHFLLSSGSTCSMLQIPDPQIKSRFWARPETDMDWTMAPSVMIGFHRMKFGLDTPLHLTTGISLRDKKGFAVDVATWQYSKLLELGMTVVAAE